MPGKACEKPLASVPKEVIGETPMMPATLLPFRPSPGRADGIRRCRAPSPPATVPSLSG